MVMYKVVFTKQALKDLEKLKEANISHKAKQLVDVVKINPYQNPPKYEKLVGNLDGILSRRINIQHRLVYQVYESPFNEGGTMYQGTVKIIKNGSAKAEPFLIHFRYSPGVQPMIRRNMR